VLKEFATVVLFVYKRVDCTFRTLSNLKLNREAQHTDLIVFSDGPKNDLDAKGVQEVRDLLSGVNGFKSVHVVHRPTNFGLAKSFLVGIDEVFQSNTSAIFLEDDNLVSENFLDFMNRSLIEFEENDQVVCISGFSYPLWPRPRKPYFLLGAETWSMATWKHKWINFERDVNVLISLSEKPATKKKMDKYGIPFSKLLVIQSKGNADSWGVRWWTSALLKNSYCLYPPRPLCINIGWGAEATHTKERSTVMGTLSDLDKNLHYALPSMVSEPKLIKYRFRAMHIRGAILLRLQSLTKNMSLIDSWIGRKKMYKNEMFSTRNASTSTAANKILEIIFDEYVEIYSVLDVGCGVGTFLRTAKSFGVKRIKGVDGPWVDKALLQIPEELFEKTDFESNFRIQENYDLIICLEVLEHVSHARSIQILEALTQNTNRILFSAAIPNQGGNQHINEQWQSHWAGYFAQKGFSPVDLIRPKIWNAPDIDFWYKQNVLMYIKNDPNETNFNSQVLLDVVHPEMYSRKFAPFSFKQLLIQLLEKFKRKVMS
jgi:SAM-dependent methyltransferase